MASWAHMYVSFHMYVWFCLYVCDCQTSSDARLRARAMVGKVEGTVSSARQLAKRAPADRRTDSVGQVLDR
jgi:hypothetical protein